MKETLRIALGTDDNITLKQERFGDSTLFRIVTIEHNAVASTELRPNSFADPTMENKPPKILGFLHDCDIFVGRSWRAGSFSLFAEHGKSVMLSDIERLDDIVAAIIHNNLSRVKVFDPQEQKFVPSLHV